jgi:phytanoyl-CoA hydroxylase
MKDSLTAQQIASHRENGFIVLPDFLSQGELEEWRGAVDEAVAARGRKKAAGLEWQEGDGYYDKVFVQRLNLWMDNERVKKLMLDARIGRLAAQLEGVDGIRVWHDQALIKEPWANPTGWHLDVPYWSFDSKHAISIWIALDDATFENGCLYFLPGTHKAARYETPGIGENVGDLFKTYPDWAKLRAVPVPMKAGSCSFHNGLTAHGAGPNYTPGRRRAMTCGFMPDGCTFNGKSNILPPDEIKKLKVGDVLNNERFNPLVYHR